mgnify:CR=1 FL=1
MNENWTDKEEAYEKQAQKEYSDWLKSEELKHQAEEEHKISWLFLLLFVFGIIIGAVFHPIPL